MRVARVPIPDAVKYAVRDRDERRCRKCGYSGPGFALHIHHIVEVQDGGGNEPENLILLCVTCHDEWHAYDATSALPFEEWLAVPPMRLMVRAWLSGMIDGDLRARLASLHALMLQDFNAYAEETGDRPLTIVELYERRFRRNKARQAPPPWSPATEAAP